MEKLADFIDWYLGQDGSDRIWPSILSFFGGLFLVAQTIASFMGHGGIVFGIDIGVFIWLIILAIVATVMGGIITLNKMAVNERREIREYNANQEMMQRMDERDRQREIREERLRAERGEIT